MQNRRSAAFGLLIWIWNISFAFGQTAGSSALQPGAKADEVGVAAAVRGGVELSRGSQIGHVVSSGESVYLKDAVTTNDLGALQILLLDQTAFTIGPNSSIVIDQFVYDPSNDTGKVNARIVKGTFRFITGKIARKKPEDMQIALPVGTIGIRGTMAMGKVDGEKSLVVLTGPGKQNNTGNKIGELLVTNEVGNETKTVNLTKTGFGTVIEGAGKWPTAPFQVPAAQLQEMTQSLSPQASGSSEEGAEGGESATEASGQDMADAGEDSSEASAVGEISGDLAAESTTASQEAGSSAQIADGIAKIQDLLSIQTGKFHFSGGPNPLSGGGTFSITYDLDFGARTAGGGHSTLSGTTNPNINSGAAFSFSIPALDFSAGGGGLATYNYSGLTDVACNSGSCTLGLTVTAFNSGGVVAANGTVAANFTGGTAVSGSATIPRFDGLST